MRLFKYNQVRCPSQTNSIQIHCITGFLLESEYTHVAIIMAYLLWLLKIYIYSMLPFFIIKIICIKKKQKNPTISSVLGCFENSSLIFVFFKNIEFSKVFQRTLVLYWNHILFTSTCIFILSVVYFLKFNNIEIHVYKI